MATEVASAYVSIGASTKDLGKAINKQFAGVEAQADKASSRITSAIGGALSTVGKIAGGAVAILGGGIAALAAKGGFDRALAIDNAQAKMVALGYSGEQVQSVMDSALNSVKGTAFGLGDAASLASQFLAAGVKEGQALDRALGAAADAAAVANVPLSDLQQVFGQLASGSQLYTQDLLQLQSRGLPVFSWLADSMGTTVDSVREMVSAGKLGFSDLQTAIEENIGGAAKATDSFSASWNNTKAALARSGAVFAVPGLAALKGLFDAAIPAIDKMTSYLEPLADMLFARLAPGLDTVKGALADFAANGFDFGSLLGSINLGDIAANLIPALQSGIQKAADWLADGGMQSIVEGFVAGRQAVFDAVLTIVPVVLEAMQTLIPALVGVIAEVTKTQLSLLPTIIETLVAMIPTLLAAAQTFFMSILNALLGVIPDLMATIATILPSLVTSLLSMIPTLLETSLSMWLALIDAVVLVLPQLLTTLLTQVLPALLTTLLEMIPSLLESAIATFIALVDALVEVLPMLIETLVGQVLPTLIETLISMVPTLVETAIVVFLALLTALIKILPKLVGGMWDIITALLGALFEAIPQLLAAGLEMLKGVGQGFLDAWPAIWEWLKSVPGMILDALGRV